MSIAIKPVCTTVPALVVETREHVEVLSARVIGVLLDPILGRHVLVTEDDAWNARDGVVFRRYAVGFARLLRQELGGTFVANTGGSEGVLVIKLAYGIVAI